MTRFGEAYPDSRLEATKKHLRAFWEGKVKTAYTCVTQEPYYRQLRDHAQMAVNAAENIIANSKYPGHYVPKLICDFGTVSTASFFGGEIKYSAGFLPFVEPIIRSPEDALRFLDEWEGKDFNFWDADAGSGIRLFRDVSEKLQTDELYCTSVDFQGPLTTSALLWEQTDFMCSMYERPEVVHKFLNFVTDYLIALLRFTIKESGGRLSGNVWPFIWLPDDVGVCMTEDYMPLLSAEIYAAFGAPYVKRISEELGGLFLHCCGNFVHQIGNLRDTGIKLLGMEIHYPHVDPAAIFDAFGGDIAFVPYASISGHTKLNTTVKFIDYIREIRRAETRLWFIIHAESEDYLEQIAAVEKMM
ncbi:MAG: hypothetical protein FWF03_02860 [Defluviitaleaceae bacterium]|nr:hypothetical protein [Defluviitaleaceae bacterium]